MNLFRHICRYLNNIFLIIIFFNIFLSSYALAFHGKVVKIQDGDTITVLSNNSEIKVRLYGIDCPEKNQAFGQAAKRFVSGLVAGKSVDVVPMDTDRYGRLVGVVSAGGVVINESLIRSGYAWVYIKYCRADFCDKWSGMEQAARKSHLGLWVDKNPMPPWDFRRMK